MCVPPGLSPGCSASPERSLPERWQPVWRRGSGRARRRGGSGRLLRRRLFRSRLGGRFRRGLGGGRSGRLGCRLRGGLGCGRFRSRLRRSLGCRLGRRFRGGLRSRFGGGLGCRLGGRGLLQVFRRGFRRRLGGGLGCRFSCRLGRCGFRRGLAAGFAAGLAAAFAAGLTLTPVSFSICLVSVSTLPCSSFTSLRLGTPRREMALFRRLSSFLELAPLAERTVPNLVDLALRRAGRSLRRTDLRVHIGLRFFFSLLAVFHQGLEQLAAVLADLRVGPRPASQICREYFSISPIQLDSFRSSSCQPSCSPYWVLATRSSTALSSSSLAESASTSFREGMPIRFNVLATRLSNACSILSSWSSTFPFTEERPVLTLSLAEST